MKKSPFINPIKQINEEERALNEMRENSFQANEITVNSNFREIRFLIQSVLEKIPSKFIILPAEYLN